MKAKSFARAALVGSLTAALLGPLSARAQTEPVPADSADAQDAQDAVETAPSAPPPLPAERRPPAPFDDATWTSGSWYWDDGTWRFKPGAWIASLPGYHYVNGYWRQEGAQWRWVEGGWARPDSLEVEIPATAVADEALTSTEAPPPAQVESPPPAPGPDAVWASGYWYWSDRSWQWIPGTWLVRPAAGWAYVGPRWYPRGGHWAFRTGGWAFGGLHVVVPLYRHAFVSVGFGNPYYPLFLRHRHWYGHGYGFRGPRLGFVREHPRYIIRSPGHGGGHRSRGGHRH